jgi:hypothetical protein
LTDRWRSFRNFLEGFGKNKTLVCKEEHKREEGWKSLVWTRSFIHKLLLRNYIENNSIENLELGRRESQGFEKKQ